MPACISKATGLVLDSLPAELSNLNFHQVEVVSRCCDHNFKRVKITHIYLASACSDQTFAHVDA